MNQETEKSELFSASPSVETRSERELLGSIEKSLREIRGVIDEQARQRQHREFSPARLIGAVLQVGVLVLLVLAVVDWIFDWGVSRAFFKVALAIVLELMAIAAFVSVRREE